MGTVTSDRLNMEALDHAITKGAPKYMPARLNANPAKFLYIHTYQVRQKTRKSPTYQLSLIIFIKSQIIRWYG
jgi:hypothetical protein